MRPQGLLQGRWHVRPTVQVLDQSLLQSCWKLINHLLFDYVLIVMILVKAGPGACRIECHKPQARGVAWMQACGRAFDIARARCTPA